MNLSVVIPVHNGGENFRRCLDALKACTRPPDEIIVVDDGSTDGSGEIARAAGARGITLGGGAHGPAFARNRGAAEARGDVLVFLDADVAVHMDVLARIEECLLDQPDVVALFGSYDDNPPARTWVSLYKNLLHHYIHQHGKREASTFWTGCGAIRRTVFADLGGFDESYVTMEDVELGARLHRMGHRVWLCPDIQATHLKCWTFASLLRSDILERAVPWTRIILRDARMPSDLNLNMRNRVSVLFVWLAVLGLILGFWLPLAWIAALAGFAGLIVSNADLYRFFARRGGIPFAIGAVGLHALYFVYSSIVFSRMWCAHHSKAVFGVIARLLDVLAKPQYALTVLLLLTFAKGIAWSTLIPPFHAPDEPQHFMYAQGVERLQNLRVEPTYEIPHEVKILFDLIQFQPVRYQGKWLDLTDRAGIASQVALLEDDAVKRTLVREGTEKIVRIRTFNNMHPPLYYALVASIQQPLEGSSILVRALASRWLSVMLAVVTVALAYQVGRELWQRQPGWALLLAALVSFQPMLTFSMAIINNGSLEIALFSASLLVCLRVIRRGMTWTRGVALGALVGLGLLTKVSFLGILPLLGLLFVWHTVRLIRAKEFRWDALAPWILAGLLCILVAGWWYAAPVVTSGDSLLSSYGTPQRRPQVNLLSYLVQYGWLTIYRPIVEMYWGNFGWLDTPLPSSLLLILTCLTAIVVWTVGWWIIRQIFHRSKQSDREYLFAICFLGCATLCMVAFYTYVDFRTARDFGARFGLQGRYYLPPIIGQMAWLLLGLVLPAPARLRRVWMWLVGAGMIGLNVFALFGLITLRYYGARSLFLVAERATVLQPMSATTLLFIGVVFLLLVGFWLVSLGGVLARENVHHSTHGDEGY